MPGVPFESSGSQSVLLRPEASASPETFEKYKILGPTPYLLNQKVWLGPSNPCFNVIQVILMLKLENHSPKALILLRHMFINGMWKFRGGLIGVRGK